MKSQIAQLSIALAELRQSQAEDGKYMQDVHKAIKALQVRGGSGGRGGGISGYCRRRARRHPKAFAVLLPAAAAPADAPAAPAPAPAAAPPSGARARSRRWLPSARCPSRRRARLRTPMARRATRRGERRAFRCEAAAAAALMRPPRRRRRAPRRWRARRGRKTCRGGRARGWRSSRRGATAAFEDRTGAAVGGGAVRVEAGAAAGSTKRAVELSYVSRASQIPAGTPFPRTTAVGSSPDHAAA